jgi:pilus assembly protein Flp/PilA
MLARSRNTIHRLTRFIRKDDEGVTAIEYALLAVLIALALILGATFLGSSLNTSFSNIGTHVNPGGGDS